MISKWKRVASFYALTWLLLLLIPALNIATGSGPLDFDSAAARASAETGLPWTSNLWVFTRLCLVEPMLWLLVLGAAVPSLAALLVCSSSRPSQVRELLNRLRPMGRDTPWRVAFLSYGSLVVLVAAGLLAVYALRSVLPGPRYFHPPELTGASVVTALLMAAFLDQGGVLEELGWRGYALPELQAGLATPLRAAILVGTGWALLKAYDNASPLIQKRALGAIHDFVRRYRSDARTCWRQYEKVAGLKKSVLEVEFAYRERMLVYPRAGGLTLLDMGDHDIVPRYSDGLLPYDLRDAVDAPPEFWPEQKLCFFTREISHDLQPFHDTEYLPEWVYYLADEQDQAASDIMEGIEGLLTGDARNPVRFIVGGQGTGKTCVLLSLLRRCQRMGISAQIAMPDDVLKYIQTCTGFPSPAAYG